MQDYAYIEAYRWYVDSIRILEGINEESFDYRVSFPPPEECFHALILRETNKVYNISAAAVYRTAKEVEEDRRRREETVGRVVSVRMPTEISGAVIELSSILNTTRRRLQTHKDRLDSLDDKASFSTGTIYDRLSRKALNICCRSDSLIDYTLLYVRSQLWRMWAREALYQLNRIRDMVENTDSNEHYNETTFPYLGHPQIMVSTLTCTALIEEVGGYYINQHPERSVKMDNTRCSDILDELEECYDSAGSIGFSIIREEITDTRTDMVHYIRKRDESIGVEDLDRYINACFECTKLVDRLAGELVETSLEDYEEKVLSEAVNQ